MNKLVFILFISCLNLNQMVENIQLIELEVNAQELYDAMDHFFENNVVEEDWEKDALVLRTEIKNEQVYIRIAPIEKDDFSWYLKGKSTTVYGFFSYKNITVLVFGKDYKDFFKKTENCKSFAYLKINEEDRPEIKDERIHGRIPLPPVYIEPHVFVYKYVENRFILYKDGLIYLLD